MPTLLRFLLLGCLFQTAKLDHKMQWNTLYSLTTDENRLISVLRYTVEKNTHVFRVTLESNESSIDNFLLVGLRQRNSMISLQVPQIIHNYEFDRVSRTLCPLQNVTDNEPFTIEVNSYQPLNYTVRTDIVTDFEIKMNETRVITASVSQPKFFHYVFPEDIDSVTVHVDSNSTTCMIVSIQEVGCLVFDLQSNVQFKGLHSTIMTHGTIRVPKSKYSEFYVVFVINENDNLCENWFNIKPMKPMVVPLLEKTFNITIEEKLPQTYSGFIGFTVAINIGIMIVSIVVLMSCETRKNDEQNVQAPSTTPTDLTPLLPQTSNTRRQNCRASSPSFNRSIFPMIWRKIKAAIREHSQNLPVNDLYLEVDHHQGTTATGVITADANNSRTGSENHEMTDLQSRSNIEKNDVEAQDIDIMQTYARLRLKRLLKNYDYTPSILLLSVLTMFTVVSQMVYQQARNSGETGDSDQCIFNFNCAHPWWVLSAGNNVFSNVPYVVVGFLIFLYNCFETPDNGRGVYKHYGIRRAIGCAIMSEGFFSAAYHVCPSRYNFQFDTFNMYLIAFLSIKQTWSNRHRQHFPIGLSLFYCITITMLGVLNMNGVTFVKYVFYIVHFGFFSFLLRVFYCQGRLENFFSFFRTQGSWSRGIFSMIVLLSNVVICIIFSDEDLFTRELYMLIVNSGLYQGYYLIMKSFTEEKVWSWKLFLLCVAAGLTWGLAIFAFMKEVSDWKTTPAHSREKNRDCLGILFGFYDLHDAWHHLSALALLLTSVLLNTIDNNLSETQRAEIKQI